MSASLISKWWNWSPSHSPVHHTYRVLILGSGLAEYTLAREVRVHDQGLPLHMITADAGDFYSKPALSTGLQNAKQAEELVNASARVMAEILPLTKALPPIPAARA
ncbi:MAG: hypothetical protein ABW201_10830 [Candidatus Thiodiazotropha sp.]